MYPKIQFRKCSVVLHRVKLHSHSGSEVSYADPTMSTAKDVSATDQVIRKKFQDDFPDIEFQNCSVILDRIEVDNHSKTDSEADSNDADDQVASEDNASEDNASEDNASEDNATEDNASEDNASEEEEASLEDNLEFDDDAIESEDIVSAHNLIPMESHIESDDDVMTAEEAAIRDQLISDGDMYDDETAASDDSFLSEDSTSIDEATFPVDCLVSSDSSIFADDDSLTSAEAAIAAEAVIAAGHLYSAEDSMAVVDTIIMAKHLKSAEASMSAAAAASASDCISCTSMPSTSHHIVNVSNADDYFSSDIIGIESDIELEEIEIQTSLASTLQEFMLTSSACPQASMSDLLNSAEAPSLGIEEIDICPDLSSSNSCMEIELQAKFGYQRQNQPK